MRRRLNFVFIYIISILFCIELFLRYIGFGSFPVYDLDKDMKYIPAASQHGSFLNHNTWFLNNRHMGNADDWTPEKHPNILLIGNSIVFGGNPYKHHEKLGPLLENALGSPYVVWSVAAGGWSELNEIAYLEKNPEILENADAVIIEYMTGGLSSFAPWPGFYIFPDNKPLILTSYIVMKYVIPRFKYVIPRFVDKYVNDFGSLPPVGATNEIHLRRFNTLVSAVAKSRKIVIFLYPSKAELLNKEIGWAESVRPIKEICEAQHLTCVDLTLEKTWTPDLYKDDGVHPTVAANRVLAEIFAANLRQ